MGVLVLGFTASAGGSIGIEILNENIADSINKEIRRKLIEEELERIFTLAPDIIVLAGTDGYLKKLNPATTRLLEYSEPELLSIPFTRIIHPNDLQNTLASIENVKTGGIPEYFEHRVTTKSGIIKWLAWDARLSTEEGILICMAKDLTERKQQAERLRKISWIQSHMVRSPLASIMGIVKLLTTPAMPLQEKEEYLGYLQIAADELDKVIREISDLSNK